MHILSEPVMGQTLCRPTSYQTYVPRDGDVQLPYAISSVYYDDTNGKPILHVALHNPGGNPTSVVPFPYSGDGITALVGALYGIPSFLAPGIKELLEKHLNGKKVFAVMNNGNFDGILSREHSPIHGLKK